MAEQLPPPHTLEVAEGVFAYIQPDGSWWLNNTGFIVGGGSVVAIDATSTERRTRSLLDAIKAVTASPVRTLVNTHHHGDHTNGNCLFTDATVIGHRLCRDSVLAQTIGGNEAVFGDVDWGELTIRPPEVVFDEHLTVYVDDVRIELHHLGTPAHTTNDVVAWLPGKRVLFTGDLVFNGGTPFMLMGSVEGFLDALPRLREFDAETLVPGHGPVCDPAAIDDGDRYAQFVLELAAEAANAGLTPLEAAREADLGEFAELHDRERIVGNLHRAMAEQAGLGRGGTVDIPAAFGDMLAFHGGKLRCLA
jgi:cyclase